MGDNIVSPNFPTPANVTGLTSAKGDLIAGVGASGLTSITAGTNGQVLTAQSGQASGLQWAASGGSVTLASAGGTQTLVVDGTGPSLTTKGLTAGQNITLTGGANDVDIDLDRVLFARNFQPTITTGGGFNTGVVSVFSTFWRVGNLIHVSMSGTVKDNGAQGTLSFTLPVARTDGNFVTTLQVCGSFNAEDWNLLGSSGPEAIVGQEKMQFQGAGPNDAGTKLWGCTYSYSLQDAVDVG